MIQKTTAMGNWWLAHSSQQCTCSCIMPLSEFFDETPNHPGDSAPLQPRFGALWLLAFPQTKMTFESEEISYHWWNSEKYNGAADGEWKNCVRSQGAYFEGDWGVIALCTMLVVSCIFFSKCLYVPITWLGTCTPTCAHLSPPHLTLLPPQTPRFISPPL